MSIWRLVLNYWQVWINIILILQLLALLTLEIISVFSTYFSLWQICLKVFSKKLCIEEVDTLAPEVEMSKVDMLDGINVQITW